MKKMKRLAALFLTLAMMLGMTLQAAAANSRTGSLTVTGAIPGAKYTLYRVLDLEGENYPSGSGTYLYKTANDDKGNWTGFVTGAGAEFVTVSDGYVVLKDGLADTASAAKAFASAAITYASENGITAQAETTAPQASGSSDTSSFTINNLPIGYYVLYSPEGNNPVSFNVDKANVTVNEKNGVPTVEKKIIEESEPVDKNSANIGDTVTYKTTITVAAGAKDYVLHDKMEAGLTFDLAKGVTGVGLISNGGTETTVDAGNYTVSKGTETTDACTFHVAFDQSWVETLHAGDKIVVHYEAVVNENATTGTDTNDNDTWLKYGQNSNTTHDKTETATYKIQIVKTDGGTSEGTEYKVLDGAQFELYRGSKEEANKISFIKTGSDYHVAQAGESGSTTVIEAGTPIIKGLEEGSYVLVETKAPDGYNKAADTTFTVNADNVVMNGTVRDNIFTPANGDTEGIHVINHDGSSLPSTGGMGTTILYIAGVILILGAGSALVLMNRKSSRRKKTRR